MNRRDRLGPGWMCSALSAGLSYNSSNLFKQPEIVLYSHADDLHVIPDNEDRHFPVLGNHHRPLRPGAMINKVITLGAQVFAASGFKYSDLDLIARGFDSRCHTANSMGVKPTSSFRDIKTP